MDHIQNTIQVHPEYAKYLPVWEMVDDCLEGCRAIKDKREYYLPKTEGMAADPNFGDIIYKRYLHNAMYPEYAQDYFIASTGLLKQSDPTLNFPESMKNEFLPSPSYIANKSLLDVYSEVQDGVMKYSRCGVLLDVPNDTEKALHKFPVLLTYDTYSIVNWGYRLYKGRKVVAWVLLSESYYDTNSISFAREPVVRYRFLGLKTHDGDTELDSPYYYTYTGGEDMTGIFDPPAPDENASIFEYVVDGYIVTYPNINGKVLEHIPFYCFTGTSISLTPERPICQSLCEACISLYGLYADYREYLYKQGFGILFGRGFETSDNIYTGVNKAVIVQSPDADLKMVESSGNGLAEYRLAINEAMTYAKSLGLAILKGNGDETGVSVAKRQGFKTASLKSISKTVAEGFVQISKTAAEWAGLSRSEIDSINIIPNVDFSATATTADLNVYQAIADANTPVLPTQDVYLNLKNKGMCSFATYDDYWKAVQKTKEERDAYLLQKKITETSELQKLQMTRNSLNDSGEESTTGAVNKEAKNAENGDTSKAVRCLETGMSYKSASEASEKVGVSTAAITRNARGLTKSAGTLNGKPMHWEYVD